jgi:hypothetical protein
MGGQACVLYGAAQFSRDVDLLLLAESSNLRSLDRALDQLEATRIAVPGLDPDALARGHAVHFRCHAQGVEGLRIDLMTRLRDLPDFDVLWDRRTTISTEDGDAIDLLSVPDLIQAKKTQRAKDWPIIDALVEGHYHAFRDQPNSERIALWLKESRTPERLVEIVARYAEEAANLQGIRPLLTLAKEGDLPALREALDAEARTEQEKDRRYWAPLKREMEAFRRTERRMD